MTIYTLYNSTSPNNYSSQKLVTIPKVFIKKLGVGVGCKTHDLREEMIAEVWPGSVGRKSETAIWIGG